MCLIGYESALLSALLNDFSYQMNAALLQCNEIALLCAL